MAQVQPDSSIPPIRTAVEQGIRSGREQPPVQLAEWFALLAIVVLWDIALYRGQGYSGLALAFATTPLLLWFASTYRSGRASSILISLMLLVLAAKLVWCGSGLLVACGAVLLVAFAMALADACPYPLEVVVFASQTILAGYEGLIHYGKACHRSSDTLKRLSRIRWLNLALPIATFCLFSTLFILANPDLLASFGQGFEQFLQWLRQTLLRLAPEPAEGLFWLAVIWLGVGLLRPVIRQPAREESVPAIPLPKDGKAPLYSAFRNTLVTVIALFAIYLVYEFTTLWFREIPLGFYYAGYAHEGAAWLTLGLALATLILSLIFRGSILGDVHVSKLRNLAWLWSLENLLLAIAVYNRLFIYIGFNGMSPMRIVGLFGMTAVVAGFGLVLWKIAYQRGFLWLVRRQLWALGITTYLFALTPADMIVVNYNVRRILVGDLAPAVQISVQPINAEGLPGLLPLVDCPNKVIREGARAMLAARYEQAQALAKRRQRLGWTAFQLADQRALTRLEANRSSFWPDYQDSDRRAAVLQAFHTYAYQWY